GGRRGGGRRLGAGGRSRAAAGRRPAGRPAPGSGRIRGRAAVARALERVLARGRAHVQPRRRRLRRARGGERRPRLRPPGGALGRGAGGAAGMTTRRRALLAALTVSALVLGIVMLVLADHTNHFSSPLAKGGVFLLLGWSFAGAGLAALVRRPENRTGFLLVTVGIYWLAASSLLFADSSLPLTMRAAAQAGLVAAVLAGPLPAPAGC